MPVSLEWHTSQRPTLPPMLAWCRMKTLQGMGGEGGNNGAAVAMDGLTVNTKLMWLGLKYYRKLTPSHYGQDLLLLDFLFHQHGII
jgi:hypothetical protein